MTSLMMTCSALAITYIVLNKISIDIRRQEAQDRISRFEFIQNNAKCRSYHYLKVLKRS